MEQIAIGTSGLKTSRIGLGTWAIGGWMWGGTDEAQSIATIRSAVERGVTLIDTAPAMASAVPRRSSARRSPRAACATRSRSPPRSAWRGRTARSFAIRVLPGSARRSRIRCDGCAPTSSTSTRCTGPTSRRRLRRPRGRWRTCAARGRSGRSASATTRPRRWMRSAPWPGSMPCSRPTTSSSARSRRTCCPMPKAQASPF